MILENAHELSLFSNKVINFAYLLEGMCFKLLRHSNETPQRTCDDQNIAREKVFINSAHMIRYKAQ